MAVARKFGPRPAISTRLRQPGDTIWFQRPFGNDLLPALSRLTEVPEVPGLVGEFEVRRLQRSSTLEIGVDGSQYGPVCQQHTFVRAGRCAMNEEMLDIVSASFKVTHIENEVEKTEVTLGYIASIKAGFEKWLLNES